jgi:hypothetical protein
MMKNHAPAVLRKKTRTFAETLQFSHYLWLVASDWDQSLLDFVRKYRVLAQVPRLPFGRASEVTTFGQWVLVDDKKQPLIFCEIIARKGSFPRAQVYAHGNFSDATKSLREFLITAVLRMGKFDLISVPDSFLPGGTKRQLTAVTSAETFQSVGFREWTADEWQNAFGQNYDQQLSYLSRRMARIKEAEDCSCSSKPRRSRGFFRLFEILGRRRRRIK